MDGVTLDCIVCGTELESALGSDPDNNQPYAGTSFSSLGHYGSTVFDPNIAYSFGQSAHSIRLEVNICDNCLKDAAEKKRVLRVATTQQRPTHVTEFWRPGAREGE